MKYEILQKRDRDSECFLHSRNKLNWLKPRATLSVWVSSVCSSSEENTHCPSLSSAVYTRPRSTKPIQGQSKSIQGLSKVSPRSERSIQGQERSVNVSYCYNFNKSTQQATNQGTWSGIELLRVAKNEHVNVVLYQSSLAWAWSYVNRN